MDTLYIESTLVMTRISNDIRFAICADLIFFFATITCALMKESTHGGIKMKDILSLILLFLMYIVHSIFKIIFEIIKVIRDAIGL